MTDFIPPLKNRETDELIEIALLNCDSWQSEAVNQAKVELLKRGITEEQQKEIIIKWDSYKSKKEAEYKKQLEINATKSYSLWEMFGIFILAPLILVRKFDISIGYSLSVLKEENYKIKYRQRLILLVSGILFWILLFRTLI